MERFAVEKAAVAFLGALKALEGTILPAPKRAVAVVTSKTTVVVTCPYLPEAPAVLIEALPGKPPTHALRIAVGQPALEGLSVEVAAEAWLRISSQWQEAMDENRVVNVTKVTILG